MKGRASPDAGLRSTVRQTFYRLFSAPVLRIPFPDGDRVNIGDGFQNLPRNVSTQEGSESVEQIQAVQVERFFEQFPDSGRP